MRRRANPVTRARTRERRRTRPTTSRDGRLRRGRRAGEPDVGVVGRVGDAQVVGQRRRARGSDRRTSAACPRSISATAPVAVLGEERGQPALQHRRQRAGVVPRASSAGAVDGDRGGRRRVRAAWPAPTARRSISVVTLCGSPRSTASTACASRSGPATRRASRARGSPPPPRHRARHDRETARSVATTWSSRARAARSPARRRRAPAARRRAPATRRRAAAGPDERLRDERGHPVAQQDPQHEPAQRQPPDDPAARGQRRARRRAIRARRRRTAPP